MNFNSLEHTVRRLTWALLDSKDDRPGHLVTDRLEASRLEELVRALYLHRIRDQELCSELARLLDQMGAVRLRRNDFTHAILRVPNDAVDLSQITAATPPTRKRSDYKEIAGSSDPATVEQAATEATVLDVAFENLLERTRQALGAV